jgi:hypothetical protein
MPDQVAGNTVYNVPRLEEVEIGDDERPVRPARILKTEVCCGPRAGARRLPCSPVLLAQILLNPFPDIVPRARVVPAAPVEEKKKPKIKTKEDVKCVHTHGSPVAHAR